MISGDGSDMAGSARDLGAALAELQALAGGFSGEIGEAARAMRTMDGEAQRLSRSLGSSLRTAFDRAVFGGGRFGDVMRGLVRDVAVRSFDAALRPVQNAVGGGVGGLVSGLIGAFGFARGAAFTGGRISALARGGVVEGPTLFPMRGGTGLMGEAGPEAVMPLTRGPDGRLGVAARGAGGGAVVTVNIATPDVEGFRRSRGQIAAELARAVSRGAGRL